MYNFAYFIFLILSFLFFFVSSSPLSVAAKSGALLSGRFAVDIGSACGLCVASPERERAGIPGPEENPPDYDGDILLAILYMKTW